MSKPLRPKEKSIEKSHRSGGFSLAFFMNRSYNR